MPGREELLEAMARLRRWLDSPDPGYVENPDPDEADLASDLRLVVEWAEALLKEPPRA